MTLLGLRCPPCNDERMFLYPEVGIEALTSRERGAPLRLGLKRNTFVALFLRNKGQGKGSELDVVEKDSPSTRLGWRFAVGVVLIVGGYIAWTLIPVAVATDLPTGVKSALTALLGATPFLTKVAAVALMGRPAYDLFKRSVLKSLRLRAIS